MSYVMALIYRKRFAIFDVSTWDIKPRRKPSRNCLRREGFPKRSFFNKQVHIFPDYSQNTKSERIIISFNESQNYKFIFEVRSHERHVLIITQWCALFFMVRNLQKWFLINNSTRKEAVLFYFEAKRLSRQF